MFSRLSRVFVDFHKREDGLSKVECAAMLGFLAAGCVIALTLGGTPTDAQRPSTFTVTFREPTRTSRVTKDTKSWASSKGRDQKVMEARNTSNGDGGAQANDVDLASRKSDKDTDAMKQSQPGHVPAATDIEDDDNNVRETEKTMSEDDARQALVGLLKAYPSSFAASVQTIQSASAVHKADHIEIDLFRCYLKSKRFTYATLRSGQPADQISGVFYQVQNGDWTGRITAVARK
jgi:hypothetical protein